MSNIQKWMPKNSAHFFFETIVDVILSLHKAGTELCLDQSKDGVSNCN
jgi:hypothetical protein